MTEVVRDRKLGEWIVVTARQKKAEKTKSFNPQEKTIQRVKPHKLSLADQVYKLRFYPNLTSIPSPTECLMAINSGIQEIAGLDIEIKEIFFNKDTIGIDMIPEKLREKATPVGGPRDIKPPKIIIACKFFKPEEHPQPEEFPINYSLKPIHAIIEYDDGMAGAEERLAALEKRGYSPEIVMNFYQPLFPSPTKPLRE